MTPLDELERLEREATRLVEPCPACGVSDSQQTRALLDAHLPQLIAAARFVEEHGEELAATLETDCPAYEALAKLRAGGT